MGRLWEALGKLWEALGALGKATDGPPDRLYIQTPDQPLQRPHIMGPLERLIGRLYVYICICNRSGGWAGGRSPSQELPKPPKAFPKPPRAFPKSSSIFILDPWGPLGDSKMTFGLPKTLPEPPLMSPKPPQNPGHQLDLNFCTPFQYFLQKVVFLRETSSLCYMKKSRCLT